MWYQRRQYIGLPWSCTFPNLTMLLMLRLCVIYGQNNNTANNNKRVSIVSAKDTHHTNKHSVLWERNVRVKMSHDVFCVYFSRYGSGLPRFQTEFCVTYTRQNKKRCRIERERERNERKMSGYAPEVKAHSACVRVLCKCEHCMCYSPCGTRYFL